MKRSKFTEEQILFGLKQVELGTRVSEVCRKLGISEVTFEETGDSRFFSRPGKSTDNAFIESFNGIFRDEFLNSHWFLSLEDAKNKIEEWRQDYNDFRPHSSLKNLTPNQFKQSGFVITPYNHSS